jgi:hypothetical protein
MRALNESCSPPACASWALHHSQDDVLQCLTELPGGY